MHVPKARDTRPPAHDHNRGNHSEPSRPTRIYILTPGGIHGRGGIVRMVEYTARTWNRPDLPITIIDTYGPGSKARMPFHFVLAYLRLLGALALRRVGLVHVNMSERLSVLRKGLLVHLAKAFSVPVVLHLHGADFADYCRELPPARLARVQRMMGKTDAVVALGSYWRDFVHTALHVPSERIAILHNAVPGPETVPVRPIARTCRILFLGVVCERKGVPTLLDALATLALQALDWHMDLAGDGELDFYRAEVVRLGLADRVSFLGWIDETGVRATLATSDILVLPSRNEGLPMAILEAMAYGLPVVATPVGSIADAITDGENGLLVPVADCAALSQALQRLVRDPVQRQAMGMRAREAYLARFDITAFNARLAQVYVQACLGLPVSPPPHAAPGGRPGAGTNPPAQK